MHHETAQTPLARFSAEGIPDVPTPAELREAFLWAETRTVTKTATVSLHGNRYEVDAALIGRKIELVFDPFDLSDLEVRYHGQGFGQAVAHVIGTHVHPRAAGHLDQPDDMPANPGIDYLALVAAEHQQATRRTINFSALGPDHRGGEPDRDDRGGDPGCGWQEPPLPFPDGDGRTGAER